MSSAKLEGLKELGRTLLIGAVSYLLTDNVITSIISYYFGAKLDTFTIALITTALTGTLRAIDRYLHESGIAEKGLTRF